MLQTVYKQACSKFLFEILQDRYVQNQNVIDRVSSGLTIEQDVRDFIKLVTDIYELGFLRATGQYQEQLTKLGYKIVIEPEKKA